MSKPSDLIPELQGRLPIRVELDALQTGDFERILTEPDASLTEQSVALLATENVTLSFTDDGIRRIAEVAWQVPSAEVQGHGPGQEVLQVGKESVGIEALEPVGNYALKIRFDDGHDTGLFTWPYLYALGRGYEENWQAYLQRLRAAGHSHTALT